MPTVAGGSFQLARPTTIAAKATGTVLGLVGTVTGVASRGRGPAATMVAGVSGERRGTQTGRDTQSGMEARRSAAYGTHTAPSYGGNFGRGLLAGCRRGVRARR